MKVKNDFGIFTHTDYKAYLLAMERQKTLRGFRSRIAEATGCQNAFVSQVLNGHVNFSLEQAMGIAALFKLARDEHQYWLWLVEHKRAGTVALRRYFEELLEALREKNLGITERVKVRQVLSAEAQAIYYGSWIYSAVHIAAMIPRLNTARELARALDVAEERVGEIVEFLVANHLLESDGRVLRSGRIQIHLDRESGNINKHHANWRVEALKSLDQPRKQDLHYSGVSSMSRADGQKVRALLVDVIERYVRLVEPSAEEGLHAFNLDFFEVLRERV